MVSISLLEKQTFIENFLKSNGVADNTWIGLKYTTNGTYEWSDGTDFFYSNWASGSPKNDSDHCVEIESDEEEFGKWSDVLCTKRNLVLCEKLQLWSLERLQTTVINLMKNPFPVGFIYAQLPKEKSPEEIWSWMTWEDISLEYESVFFRVDGRNSAPFGTVQEQASPRIAHVKYIGVGEMYYDIDIYPNNELSEYIVTQMRTSGTIASFGGIAFNQTAEEVRPRNMAIRIWKRTG